MNSLKICNKDIPAKLVEAFRGSGSKESIEKYVSDAYASYRASIGSGDALTLHTWLLSQNAAKDCP